MSPETNFLIPPQSSPTERLAAFVMAAQLVTCTSYVMETIEESREQDATYVAQQYYWKWGDLNGRPVGQGPASQRIDMFDALSTVVVSGENEDGLLSLHFSPQMPQPYQHAFSQALEHPIVQEALAQDAVDQVQAVTSLFDNGEFRVQPDEAVPIKEVKFYIGNAGTIERTFLTDRDVESVAIHEFMHALTNEWYPVYKKGESTGDPVLDQHIAGVDTACHTLLDPLYRKHLPEFRKEIAGAFDETAGILRHETQQEQDTTGMDSGTRGTIADAMESAGDAVLDDSPEVYAALDNHECAFPPLTSVAEQFLAEDNKLDESRLVRNLQTEPLDDAEMALRKRLGREYACVKEGGALQEAFHPSQKSPAGHPYDNPSEAISSITSILAENPAYLEDCLDGMKDPKLRHAFADLVNKVVDLTAYAQPKVLEILRRNPEAAAAIDHIRQQ